MKIRKYQYVVFWFGEKPSLVCMEGYFIHGESKYLEGFKELSKVIMPTCEIFMISNHEKTEHAFTRAQVEQAEHVRKYNKKSSAKVANIKHYLDYMEQQKGA